MRYIVGPVKTINPIRIFI